MHRTLAIWLLVCCAGNLFAAPVSPTVVDLNTPREFPVITTQAQWEERAKSIREQILVSSGLWPMPEKTPLRAKIFGKIVRDGYSVEKVYFQALPGFYVAGNLYRPLGRGLGPFPAVLTPHGHWATGRLVDDSSASFAGLCINFARQGIIAFSYDMVGYNDTHFAGTSTNTPFAKLHHSFETNDPAALLWGVSLMGLQTWDSIRAVDFLVSLPDVDAHRLGCTGASGGGTQTMLLGAIDDRITALAPVVMVSHSMQGGCLCENMPGLRVEFSNMEIAAAAAPRPQIMIGCSGDWTKTMLTLEGPAVAHIYDLLRAPDNLRYARFDFPHNYNQTSREAVYQWFDKTLLAQPDAPVKELAFQKEPDADLRVFPDGKLPADALSQRDLVNSLIELHRKQMRAMLPKDKDSLDNYQRILKPALAHTLLTQPYRTKWAQGNVKGMTPSKHAYFSDEHAQEMWPEGEHRSLKMHFFTIAATNAPKHPFIFVLADQQGGSSLLDADGAPRGAALAILDHEIDVGILETPIEKPAENQNSIFFNTYNLTTLQKNVNDLRAAAEGGRMYYLEKGAGIPRIVLCGIGRAGLWSLLAASSADAVIADCDGLDVSDDKNFLAPDLFCPGLRNVDTFNGALILAAPHPLLLHNTAGKFPAESLRNTYKLLDASKKLRTEKGKLTDDQIVDWISKLPTTP